ncbi:type IV pilus twitching motility protein PilT [Alicyclobacillus pomorum]|jgi:twitching motility protein PilT|uniref:type IV pilus twitching motility protein PilT n=1 Tax=Alicyclobacillus pomorum TaxID=204470 RepID=UPI0004155984|nr:type IV pilus twitching motility protein PilT [Alicyclobacillus pomorum]
MDILSLLTRAHAMQASDLHISANAPPMFRVCGELRADGEVLQSAETEAMGRQLMTDEQWQRFTVVGELDFSYRIPGTSRYRINVYRQRGCVSLAARVIPDSIPDVRGLGLPDTVLQFTERPHGLVLVTGPTGSGKSTTLAALIHHMNQTVRRHIITLEDPIEYVHRHQLCMIDQREIGLDTQGFARALRAALRQDPDVILVGEMRDLETIRTAITAAETGHLVFASLHTSNAVQTVERIVDVFPSAQQSQMRIQLASVLQGIVAQRLYKTIDGTGRVAAVEVLVNTPAVANLIRSDKVHQIRSVMQTSKAFGMQTMDVHLRELVALRKVAPQAVANEKP